MNPTLFRILMFSMVPLGIYLLVRTIRMVRKTFNGNILLDMPFEQKQAYFQISAPGHFAIWQQGQLFTKTPLGNFKLQILDERGTTVKLRPTWFNVHKNGWKTARTEIKKFSAAAGNYTLQILNEPDGNILTKLISDVIPLKPVDKDQYSIQIRESQPVYYFAMAVPLFTLSGFLMIVGFVAGLAGPQIAIDFGIFAAP